nr:peptidoglycan DD-metalloendopeptidase family protein [uncultured Glaciecola sp.]
MGFARTGIVAISLILLTSCSGRSQPAPVMSLNTSVAKQNNLTEIDGEIYEVQKGDTLFAVAFYSGNDYLDIAKYNDIKPPYGIYPGQTLTLIPPSEKNNKNENKDITSDPNSYTKVVVDPAKTQAYGERERKKHREKSNKKHETSDKPDNDVIWIWPASGESTSAVVGSDGTNRGVDIKGDLYSPIYAAANGKVVYAGNALKGYGNLIIIKHENNLLSAYAHNDTILVSEQRYVKQGQKIATMGRTGSSDVMLHFEIRRKGKSLDPFRFLPKK